MCLTRSSIGAVGLYNRFHFICYVVAARAPPPHCLRDQPPISVSFTNREEHPVGEGNSLLVLRFVVSDRAGYFGAAVPCSLVETAYVAMIVPPRFVLSSWSLDSGHHPALTLVTSISPEFGSDRVPDSFRKPILIPLE